MERAMKKAEGWAWGGLAAAAVMAASSWSWGFGKPAAPEPTAPAAAPAVLLEKGLETLWSTEVLPDAGTEVVSAWVVGDYVVVRGTDNRLFCVRALSGERLWSRPVAAAHETVWRPALDGDTLWMATTTHLLGVGAATGKAAWSRDLDFPPSGPVATNGTHCFVPDAKGWLQAVAVVGRTPSWGRWTDSTMTAGPVVDSGAVYFASQSGVVYASAQNVRRVLWRYRTEGAVTADLRLGRGGVVLAASHDYSVYAFSGSTGEMVWRFNAGEPVAKPAYTVGDQVYVFRDVGGMTALDVADGSALWELASGADFVSAGPETVYVRSVSDMLLAVDRSTGAVGFGVPMRRDVVVATNETGNGVIYLATPDGDVMAVGKRREEP